MTVPQPARNNLEFTVSAGQFLCYVGGNQSVEACRSFAMLSDGLILKGDRGLEYGRKLRAMGFDGSIMGEPAAYERNSETQVAQLKFEGVDPTIIAQSHLQVSAFLSPSTFVEDGSFKSLDR